MRANVADRVRLAWNTARFFLRMLIEYAGTVWLLGLAPFLAHLAASWTGGAYEWVPADLWLFVMVLGGNVAIEAFKDRESDGPSRPLAAMLGGPHDGLRRVVVWRSREPQPSVRFGAASLRVPCRHRRIVLRRDMPSSNHLPMGRRGSGEERKDLTLMPMPPWLFSIIFYTLWTLFLAGFIVLVITLPYRMMQVMKEALPRRRSTDVNRETSE